MTSVFTDLGRIGRPVLVTLAGLVVIAAIVAVLKAPGLTVLWSFVWLSVLGVAVAGLFMIIRARRPIAGIGALLAGFAVALAFLWRTPPAGVVWTLILLAGALAVVIGTSADTASPRSWPILLPRLAVGWAFIDNSVNDMVWVSGGTNGFLGAATAALKREPQLLDGGYQPFLQNVVLPRPDTFAGLFLSGELVFGLLLLLGLFSAIGATGAMWLSANIILEKSFMSHGAYIDKTYFAAELFCLVAAAGFVYGLDASLARQLPRGLTRWLAGGPEAEDRTMPRQTVPAMAG
jgi:TQO small subunit DoxD